MFGTATSAKRVLVCCAAVVAWSSAQSCGRVMLCRRTWPMSIAYVAGVCAVLLLALVVCCGYHPGSVHWGCLGCARILLCGHLTHGRGVIGVLVACDWLRKLHALLVSSLVPQARSKRVPISELGSRSP